MSFSSYLPGIRALAVAMLLSIFGLGAATAAPVSSSLSKGAVAGYTGLLQQVHGCHRSPRIGPVTGVLHRHIGPGCRWVPVRRYRRPVYRYCRRWRRECRYRWGGGWRYRRCMRRHGC